MVQFRQANLVRTTQTFKSQSFKGLIVDAIASPVRFFTQTRQTDFFLKDVSFEIQKGERVALLGRNGSGKTTLCRMIAKELFPSAGQAHCTSQVSFFSQLDACLIPELSGYENLQMLADFTLSHFNLQQKSRVIAECIEFSEIGEKIHHAVETYSQGMKSRLSLSFISAVPRDLLILDEVHTHADVGFRQKLSQRIRHLITESNIVIIVSHFEEDLRHVCNRGLVLDQGQIVFDGGIEKALACHRLLNGLTRV